MLDVRLEAAIVLAEQYGQAAPLSLLKQVTQAPVNGGRNYNGPKVAKFLVG